MLFVCSIFISIFVLELPKLWFCFYCFFVGEYLLIKSHLYKTDSHFYLGSLLAFLGLILGLNYYFNLVSNFYVITGAFIYASLFTFFVYKDLFHLFLSVILAIVSFLYLLYRQNILNIYIFFAGILLIVFIFSFIYVKIKK